MCSQKSSAPKLDNGPEKMFVLPGFFAEKYVAVEFVPQDVTKLRSQETHLLRRERRSEGEKNCFHLTLQKYKKVVEFITTTGYLIIIFATNILLE
jgi:hypothetical protein